MGAATYEHARHINNAKGFNMVQYLRARRALADVTRGNFKSYALENKVFHRREFLKRKKFGLRPYKLII